MTESKYEKYVVRKPMLADPSINWGRPELGVITPFFFLLDSGPIKESNAMIEFFQVVKDSTFGVTEERPPHKHDCDEIFMFAGSGPKDDWQSSGKTLTRFNLDSNDYMKILL